MVLQAREPEPSVIDNSARLILPEELPIKLPEKLRKIDPKGSADFERNMTEWYRDLKAALVENDEKSIKLIEAFIKDALLI